MKKNFGFTLLELIVVIGLIGLMSAAILPRIFSSSDRYSLSADVRSVVSLLRESRAMAIESHDEKVISFNLTTKEYSISGEKDKFFLDDNTEIEVFTAESEITADDKLASIRFFPDGSSTGGRIKLVYDEEARGIDIIWVTGQVNIVEELGNE